MVKDKTESGNSSFRQYYVVLEGFCGGGEIRIDKKASPLPPGRTHWGLSGPAVPITLQWFAYSNQYNDFKNGM